jgi:hypothetical protein
LTPASRAAVDLRFVDLDLVVLGHQARGAQDRPAQPLQAEDQQQAADEHPKQVDRQRGQRRAERGHDHGECEHCGAGAAQR